MQALGGPGVLPPAAACPPEVDISIDPQAYLWDSNQVVVQWLEQHWSARDNLRSTIRENINYLKRDSVLKTIQR